MDEQRFNASADPFGLQQLPVFAPGDGLWPRVLAGQRQRRRIQRWQRGGATVAAAVFACAAIVLLPHPQAPLQQDIVAVQRESHALEGQWLQVANAAVGEVPNLTRVRMIDADLQAAYDRGADARDIAPLWQQRNEALRGLIARARDTNTDTAPLLTRI